jgi:tight adherence protein B
MKLKIRAMSSESKASAYIVGALPVRGLHARWMINPTTWRLLRRRAADRRRPRRHGLDGIGGFIMAKMVNFEI